MVDRTPLPTEVDSIDGSFLRMVCLQECENVDSKFIGYTIEVSTVSGSHLHYIHVHLYHVVYGKLIMCLCNLYFIRIYLPISHKVYPFM